MNTKSYIRIILLALLAVSITTEASATQVLYKTVKVDNIEVFYREAGDPGKPALLLHGFPTSSQMFRNLIPALAEDFHLIAPDYPGYGNSGVPSREDFKYTFYNDTVLVGQFVEQIGLKRYALYLQDYGAPIGFRLAVAHPERVSALIIQNGNAYDEGIDNAFWEPVKK